jgi:Uma2 family endonuclease
MRLIKTPVQMKVPEFLAWTETQPEENRYELVDGEVVAMTRDTVRYNRTRAAVWRAFDDAVRATRLPCLVLVDGVGVVINEQTLRIPDVVVQCGAEPDPNAMVLDSPLIVVEVISPSSEREDTDAKLIEYFSVVSIHHYLIVFSGKRVVVHHQRNERNAFDTRILPGGEIVLNPPGLSVAVAVMLGRSSSDGENVIG